VTDASFFAARTLAFFIISLSKERVIFCFIVILLYKNVTRNLRVTQFNLESQPFDFPTKNAGFGFGLSSGRRLRVDPERRFFTPPSKVELGATEWAKFQCFRSELIGLVLHCDPALPMPNPNSFSFSEAILIGFYLLLWYVLGMIRFKKIPEDIHQKIDLLTDLFMGDSNIIFAYLFGGLVRDKRKPLSDVDLGIYVKNIKGLNYLTLFSKISQILCTDEIDLVVLNSAPISLAGRSLQKRKILIDKDPFLRHKYESRILREFFDFTIKEKEILHRRYGIG
jgi:hypothetical protein